MNNFSFDVDESYAKKNNELLRDAKRLQVSALSLGLILVAGAIALYFFANGTIWMLLIAGVLVFLALLCFIMIPVIPRQMGNAQTLYDNYELVPAVIAEVNPRDVIILALVNTNVDTSIKPQWALATRTIVRVGAHERRLGERIPSVAITGRRTVKDQDHWDEISPMPITWGTTDKDVIRSAEKTIPHELWAKLEKNRGKLEEVKKTRNNLLPL
ncbi:hypothetical protein CDES_04100 [Corynebacterium deserti GIMN1.010]|uniref:DUF3239 domain-containing protein n=1 Tax=Corynebacterium deserti GIMN1.010 TaxID=931089 RepID=A0A0M4CD06_9CORY|nr:DUF3239 domain-containing protein [Corynebacterium deserti]ALC05266.1 hypothetical protein CDES_04100 [Corynebacterium deserti GIMN1.010]